MDKKIKAILLISLISLITFSSFADDVVIIQAGEKAPYTGYLFPKETAQLTRVKLIEGEEAAKLNESYVRSIEIYRKNEDVQNQKVNILLERNDNLAKSLTDAREMTTFEKVAWFAGGIILSGAAVYGASQLRR